MLTLRDIERVLHFEAYVVTDLAPLKEVRHHVRGRLRRQAQGIR
jgi:hypothetical protein